MHAKVAEALALLKGSFDMHVHSAPDLMKRKVDDFELAEHAMAVGMRGALIKDHYANCAPRATLANTKAGREVIYGSITLNRYVGGFNVYALESAIRLGAKAVWMPTKHAANDLVTHANEVHTHSQMPFQLAGVGSGMTVFGDDGKLLPEVIDIIQLAVEHNICIMTGHLSNREAIAVLEEALARGSQKAVFTHPDYKTNLLPMHEQAALAKRGVYMEKTLLPVDWECVSRAFTAESIRAIGASRCFVATDYGQFNNPTPWEGMLKWICILLEDGFSHEEVVTMTAGNAVDLLDLA